MKQNCICAGNILPVGIPFFRSHCAEGSLMCPDTPQRHWLSQAEGQSSVSYQVTRLSLIHSGPILMPSGAIRAQVVAPKSLLPAGVDNWQLSGCRGKEGAIVLMKAFHYRKWLVGANELRGPCEYGLCGAVCDNHSGRWRWWVSNIISGHDEHFACTRTGGIERESNEWMNEWADGSASQLCTNSIWQVATGKRVRNECWRGPVYFTVTGAKWGKAWKMSWSPFIKCLPTADVLWQGRHGGPSSNVMSILFCFYSWHNTKQVHPTPALSILRSAVKAAVNLACRGI